MKPVEDLPSQPNTASERLDKKYFSSSYLALACFRMRITRSPSFERLRKPGRGQRQHLRLARFSTTIRSPGPLLMRQGSLTLVFRDKA